MKHFLTLILVIFISATGISGEYSGVVLSAEDQQPVSYVNIGVIGKGVGTVSCSNGLFRLGLNDLSDSDTIMFSCIGYHPEKISLGEFRKQQQHNVFLQRHIVELQEVTVRPQSFKDVRLGNTTRSKMVSAGFKENLPGYELGVVMKVKDPVFLETININIARTNLDTIFYRLNIYSIEEGNEFRNILQSPIFIILPADKVKETIVVDLVEHNLSFDNDFLITLEHIRDAGSGYLYFCAGLKGRTWHRKTSQASWESTPIGIGISAEVKVARRGAN